MRPQGSVQPRPAPIESPQTVDIVSVPLALIDYRQTLDWIDAMVAERRRGYVCVCNVHTVMASREDRQLRDALDVSSLNVPDGQPLVWALNALGHPLRDRVYGPELMSKACAAAVENGQRFYLYGGRNQGALVQLALNLRQRYPGIKIVGGLFAPAPPADRGGARRDRRGDQPFAGRRRVGRNRRAQAGEVDGADAPAARGAGAARRRRGV